MKRLYMLIMILVLIASSSGVNAMNAVFNLFGKKEEPVSMTVDELKKIAEQLYLLKAQLVHENASFNKSRYDELKREISNIEEEQKLRRKNKNNDLQLRKKVDEAELNLEIKKSKATLPIETWQEELLKLNEKHKDLLLELVSRDSDKKLEEDLIVLNEELKKYESQINDTKELLKKIIELENNYSSKINNAVENKNILSYIEWVSKTKPTFTNPLLQSVVQIKEETKIVEEVKKTEISVDDMLLQKLQKALGHTYIEDIEKDLTMLLPTINGDNTEYKPQTLVALFNLIRDLNFEFSQEVKKQNDSVYPYEMYKISSLWDEIKSNLSSTLNVIDKQHLNKGNKFDKYTLLLHAIGAYKHTKLKTTNKKLLEKTREQFVEHVGKMNRGLTGIVNDERSLKILELKKKLGKN